jgi:hypothetical protein
MDQVPNNEVRSGPALIGIVAVLLMALSACTTTPTPRGYANPGVPTSGTRQQHDGAYYTGADPAFPRTGKGGGGGGSGE